MTEVYYPNSDNNSADRWPEALGVSEHIHHSMVEEIFNLMFGGTSADLTVL